jgi:hypothetical protein
MDLGRKLSYLFTSLVVEHYSGSQKISNIVFTKQILNGSKIS